MQQGGPTILHGLEVVVVGPSAYMYTPHSAQLEDAGVSSLARPRMMIWAVEHSLAMGAAGACGDGLHVVPVWHLLDRHGQCFMLRRFSISMISA